MRDAVRGEDIGAIKRKGIKAIFKDEWIFLSKEGQEIGKLTERSMARAFLSRRSNLIPQTYLVVSADNRKIGEIRQHFNPFVLKYSMTVIDPEPSIDRRLLIAAGVLLAAIEQRQR